MKQLILSILSVTYFATALCATAFDNQTLEFPLRIPPVIKDFYREKIILHRPKRSNLRKSKQLQPGVYSCGHQGNDMFVNFINPRYPGPDTAAGTCHFRLLKHSPDICQV